MSCTAGARLVPHPVDANPSIPSASATRAVEICGYALISTGNSSIELGFLWKQTRGGAEIDANPSIPSARRARTARICGYASIRRLGFAGSRRSAGWDLRVCVDFGRDVAGICGYASLGQLPLAGILGSARWASREYSRSAVVHDMPYAFAAGTRVLPHLGAGSKASDSNRATHFDPRVQTEPLGSGPPSRSLIFRRARGWQPIS